MESLVLSLSNKYKNCSITNNGYDNNFKIISSKKDLLMQSLINFFTNRNNLDQVIPIITGKSKISLRILDWFVTRFCYLYKLSINIYREANRTHEPKCYIKISNSEKSYSMN
jgi:hypothetical protein